MLDVYVDDVKVTSLNQYAATTTYQQSWTSSILPNKSHTIKLVHASGTTTYLDAVQYFNSYQVRTGSLSDAGSWTDTNWYGISDAWTAIEISYQAYSNTGSVTLWLDGNQKESRTFIDNDTQTLTEVRLGAQGVEAGTSGPLYFDDFESRRFSYIGTLPDPGVEDSVVVSQAGWEDTLFNYAGPQPHAVASLSTGASYEYDANGNMTCRT